MFKFGILDPRPVGTEANALLVGPNTFGVEVTVQALADQCGLGNLDPQHSGQNADQAAIEAALTVELPAEGATLVTVRADLDSVGAMALLSIRARDGQFSAAAVARIMQVSAADKFARGEWGGVKPLPTKENPWPAQSAGASDTRGLSAIAAAVADFKVPIADRVSWMEQWLMTGEEPGAYRAQVDKERIEMIEALSTDAITHRTEGKIAVVVSTHRAATMVGYSLAPVVVALNPEFSFQGGLKHAKFTVSQYKAGSLDLKAAFTELSALEAGWGGSPTIGGSPQGVNSTLKVEQVVEIISKHLIK
ncbi:hypothetical protein KBA63_01660 [Candidatus Woesebacteria bacterium]|nr:hypothetical protein [Candidatus Woesebacteria bacterium]